MKPSCTKQTKNVGEHLHSIFITFKFHCNCPKPVGTIFSTNISDTNQLTSQPLQASYIPSSTLILYIHLTTFLTGHPLVPSNLCMRKQLTRMQHFSEACLKNRIFQQTAQLCITLTSETIYLGHLSI